MSACSTFVCFAQLLEFSGFEEGKDGDRHSKTTRARMMNFVVQKYIENPCLIARRKVVDIYGSLQ